MKIQDSVVSLYGSRTYLKKTEETENLKTWVGSTRPDFEGTGNASAGATLTTGIVDSVDLSPAAKSTLATGRTAGAAKGDPVPGDGEDLKTLIIKRLLEALTGKKIEIGLPGGLQTGRTGSAISGAVAAARQAEGQPVPQAQGWGLEYDYHKSEYENEKTDFAASGTIRTTDGREIDFFAEMSMSREFMAEENISLREGDAVKIDPLIINFDGAAPTLTAAKFGFDLDSDGAEEQISFLAPGAGFLALDSNENGTIDDGNELFGPETGSGFEELSAFDEDGNGWIDEGDRIFTRLRIWTKSPEGTDTLTGLAASGIGAIYLGRVDTPFSINAEGNTPLGSVKESGVYLNEDGSAGTVQEIDLNA